MRVGPSEWRDLAAAQWALLTAQLLVWTRPTGKLVDAVSMAGVTPLPRSPQRAQQLALAVERVAEHGLGRPPCLVRAVALNRLLDRRGIPGSRIRVGVRKDEHDFVAHAWVELGDRVLGDRPEHVRQFVELTDVRVTHR
jgi:hypothetical protein